MPKQKRFVNREISWLYFNDRVLQEAMDENNPVIERLKFLGIFSNNRDEFFRVRVATIKRMVQIQKKKNVKPKAPAEKILKEILKTVEEQEKKFNSTFLKLQKELKKQNIIFLDDTQLNKKQGEFVQQTFKNEVVPNLFPIMLKSFENPDALQDNAIYLAVQMLDSTKQKEDDYALIMVPSNTISRFLLIPSKGDKNYVIMLDDVMRYCMSEIFAPFGFDSFISYTIKFTRDAELDIDNDISKSFIKLINNEIRNAKAGKEAWAIIKLNNLVDEKITNKIYQASQAGVKIDIICRGICILIPHVDGLSENINVINIVDKFLEHSRTLVFVNGGNPKYYISSADWMVRNFDHRFETTCPVYDKKLQQEIMDILQIQLSDNVKARLLNVHPINKYQFSNKEKPVRSQTETYSYLKTYLNNAAN